MPFCFNATRNTQHAIKPNHAPLHSHTHSKNTRTNKTKKLKEEFIGPIPDPLLNWVTELSNVSATQRWVLLKTLKAASVYQFRVSAVNSVGEGPPSESSNVIRLPQEGEFGYINMRNKIKPDFISIVKIFNVILCI